MDPMKEKKNRLQEIYGRFETSAADYQAAAVCRPGCSFCCTAPRIDITTLEGWVIREHLRKLPRTLRDFLKKKLAQDRRGRKPQKQLACPFLNNDRMCRIYAVRPFACRRLYSVRECGPTGPMLHRGVHAAARTAVQELQALDAAGYSGHISFILELLEKADFRLLYSEGRCRPDLVAAFGRSRGLIVNRLAVKDAAGGPERAASVHG